MRVRWHRWRFRRLSAICLVLVLAVAASPATATPQAAPVQIDASLSCVQGGVEVTFTIENLGDRVLDIQGDFHLFLTAVRPGGQEPVGAVFVFPAPGFDQIPAGEERTFIVPISEVDVRAQRLILRSEVVFQGRSKPVKRHFSFSGCN